VISYTTIGAQVVPSIYSIGTSEGSSSYEQASISGNVTGNFTTLLAEYIYGAGSTQATVSNSLYSIQFTVMPPSFGSTSAGETYSIAANGASQSQAYNAMNAGAATGYSFTGDDGEYWFSGPNTGQAPNWFAMPGIHQSINTAASGVGSTAGSTVGATQYSVSISNGSLVVIAAMTYDMGRTIFTAPFSSGYSTWGFSGLGGTPPTYTPTSTCDPPYTAGVSSQTAASHSMYTTTFTVFSAQQTTSTASFSYSCFTTSTASKTQTAYASTTQSTTSGMVTLTQTLTTTAASTLTWSTLTNKTISASTTAQSSTGSVTSTTTAASTNSYSRSVTTTTPFTATLGMPPYVIHTIYLAEQGDSVSDKYPNSVLIPAELLYVPDSSGASIGEITDVAATASSTDIAPGTNTASTALSTQTLNQQTYTQTLPTGGASTYHTSSLPATATTTIALVPYDNIVQTPTNTTTTHTGTGTGTGTTSQYATSTSTTYQPPPHTGTSSLGTPSYQLFSASQTTFAGYPAFTSTTAMQGTISITVSTTLVGGITLPARGLNGTQTVTYPALTAAMIASTTSTSVVSYTLASAGPFTPLLGTSTSTGLTTSTNNTNNTTYSAGGGATTSAFIGSMTASAGSTAGGVSETAPYTTLSPPLLSAINGSVGDLCPICGIEFNAFGQFATTGSRYLAWNLSFATSVSGGIFSTWSSISATYQTTTSTTIYPSITSTTSYSYWWTASTNTSTTAANTMPFYLSSCNDWILGGIALTMPAIEVTGGWAFPFMFQTYTASGGTGTSGSTASSASFTISRSLTTTSSGTAGTSTTCVLVYSYTISALSANAFAISMAQTTALCFSTEISISTTFTQSAASTESYVATACFTNAISSDAGNTGAMASYPGLSNTKLSAQNNHWQTLLKYSTSATLNPALSVSALGGSLTLNPGDYAATISDSHGSTETTYSGTAQSASTLASSSAIAASAETLFSINTVNGSQVTTFNQWDTNTA
jgi:hypothetical protein